MNKENNKISKVILNLIQDLQRLLGSFSNGVRGRCQIKFGMTSYVKGFTLIEILIAVLIIGVLVAVAVPQYQKAVLKSRFSSLMPTTKAVRDGQEMYYMTNGRYADAVNKLDVTATNNSGMTITLSDDSDYAYTMATRPTLNNNLIMYQKHSANFPGEVHCEALKGNTQAEWLCETALHGTPNLGQGITRGYTEYVIEGSGFGLTPMQKAYQELLSSLTCSEAITKGFDCSMDQNRRTVCHDNVCVTTEYNPDGGKNVTLCVKPDNGSGCTPKTTEYYDADGKIYAKCAGGPTKGACTSGFSDGSYVYEYDTNGNLTSVRYCTKTSEDKKTCLTTDNWRTHTDYNKYIGDQLISKTICNYLQNGECANNGNSTTYNYKYDKDGNMTAELVCDGKPEGGICTKYRTTGNYFYTYDGNGNVTSVRQCAEFTDDYACTKYAKTSSNTNFNYMYDSNGKLIAKQSCPTGYGETNVNCQAGRIYKYDGNNLVSDYYCMFVLSNGTCKAGYESKSGGIDYIYENGRLKSERTFSDYGDGTSYNAGYDYIYDDTGNIVAKLYCSAGYSAATCSSYYASRSTFYTYDEDGHQTSTQGCTTLSTDNTRCVKHNTNTSSYSL